MKDNKGFTLIELTVVVAILGILAAIIGGHYQEKNGGGSTKVSVKDGTLSITTKGKEQMVAESKQATSGNIQCDTLGEFTTNCTQTFVSNGVQFNIPLNCVRGANGYDCTTN